MFWIDSFDSHGIVCHAAAQFIVCCLFVVVVVAIQSCLLRALVRCSCHGSEQGILGAVFTSHRDALIRVLSDLQLCWASACGNLVVAAAVAVAVALMMMMMMPAAIRMMIDDDDC